jgi:phage-related protein
MTIPVFTPPRNADQGAEVAIKPAVLSSTLGDQYVQRAPNGINTQMRKMTLRWTNLYNDEAKEIINFFKLMGRLPTFLLHAKWRG